MKEYEELKKELKEIAQILKEYPESLHTDVFNLMSKAIMGNLDFSESRITSKKEEVNKEINSSSKEKPTSVQNDNTNNTKKRTSSPKGKTTNLKHIKTLDLNPKGKTSFEDFRKAKNPTNQKHKCIVSIYWLKEIAEHEKVGIDHIYTLFKAAEWPLPADLANMMHQAGTKGWLDTSDKNDYKITTIGENEVEHKLPNEK